MYIEIKKFFNQSVIFGIGNIINKIIGFLMIPIYTRFLSPEDYGVIAVLVLFSTFISALFEGNVNYSFMRFYFYRIKKNKLFGTSLTILILISVSITLIGIFFPKQLSIILFLNERYSFFILITALTIAVQLVGTLPFSLLLAKNEPIKYIIFSTIKLFIGLALNIYFIAILGLGVMGFLYSGFLTALIITIILLYYSITKVGISYSKEMFKKMLRFIIPIIPVGLLYFLYNNSDIFFLQRFSNLHNVGLYQLALQFSSVIIQLIFVPFNLSFVAYQFKIYKEKKAKVIFPKIETYFATILIFAGLTISLLISDVLKILTGSKFWDASMLVPFLIVAMIIWSLHPVVLSPILIKNKTEYIFYVYLFALFVNLFLSFLLIPILGAQGAAITKIITFGFILISFYFVSQKLIPIHYEFKRLAILCFLALLFFFMGKFILAQEIILSILLKIVLILLFPVSLLIIGFFKKEEIAKAKYLVKKNIIFNKLISFLYRK